MTNALTIEGMKYMIALLLENANEAVEESKADSEDMFTAGRRLAYYEIETIRKVIVNSIGITNWSMSDTPEHMETVG